MSAPRVNSVRISIIVSMIKATASEMHYSPTEEYTTHRQTVPRRRWELTD
ncbi:MAG TPA: hypothetical protein PLY82_09245 [Methanosarcina thermophila]|nr:hypothetical protein [Methanosarcina thermophila]HOQ66116.1 hypothetical protein [Methanosarcina thermophila]HPT80457.1 hypothetical protein [Methanosarcina thermophila]